MEQARKRPTRLLDQPEAERLALWEEHERLKAAINQQVDDFLCAFDVGYRKAINERNSGKDQNIRS